MELFSGVANTWLLCNMLGHLEAKLEEREEHQIVRKTVRHLWSTMTASYPMCAFSGFRSICNTLRPCILRISSTGRIQNIKKSTIVNIHLCLRLITDHTVLSSRTSGGLMIRCLRNIDGKRRSKHAHVQASDRCVQADRSQDLHSLQANPPGVSLRLPHLATLGRLHCNSTC